MNGTNPYMDGAWWVPSEMIDDTAERFDALMNMHAQHEAEAHDAWEAQNGPLEYPRGDWSGNPDSFYKSPLHLGGDLPPGHPWLAHSFDERAAMWAEGQRPWMADSRMAPEDEPGGGIDLDTYFSTPFGFMNAMGDVIPFAPQGGEAIMVRVGWSQPPHPIEFIPSVHPKDSHQAQARSVLYDYFHDNDVRAWVDDGTVKAAFGVKQKEDYDPVQLIAAYENKHHPVWSKGAQAPGLSGAISASQHQLSWQAMHAAVDKAIAKRLKLGPLPESNYDSDPVVIYYYDNDTMKKITYPRIDIPDALHPGDTSWWKHGGIGTYQSNDPTQIAKERANPGFPGGGGWGGEGFDWDKDVAGNVQAIVAGIMEVVGAIVQVIPGVGTAVGTALIIGGAIVASIAGAIDDAFQGKDNAGALAGIAKGLMQAASAGLKAETGVTIPPAAMKTLSGTVDMIAADVSAGQKKRLSYTELWNNVASKAKQYGKLGDAEAHAISVILGENAAGHLFIQGHTVGKYASMKQIEAISKIVQGFSVFVKDPKALNIFLLGAGIGHLTAHQEGKKPPMIKSHGSHATHGEFVGQDTSTKQYGPLNRAAVQALLSRAAGSGMSVVGNNPWDIDAHQHGVQLHASWDPSSGIVTVSITNKYLYVPNSKVWEQLDTVAGGAEQTHVGGVMAGARSPKDALDAFVAWRLKPRYGLHKTAGPYDVADDVHQDERVEAAQSFLNELRGSKYGDPLYLMETGVLDPRTRDAVRNFQFEAGVGPCDGTPTLDTLLALQAEVNNKREVLAGAFAAGFDWPEVDLPVAPHTTMVTRTDPRSLYVVPHAIEQLYIHDYVVPQVERLDRWLSSGEFFAGQSSLVPQPDYGGLSRGCPTGTWYDPFTHNCRSLSLPLPQPTVPSPTPPMPTPPPPVPLMSTQGYFAGAASEDGVHPPPPPIHCPNEPFLDAKNNWRCPPGLYFWPHYIAPRCCTTPPDLEWLRAFGGKDY